MSQPVDAGSLGDALAPSSHKDEGLSVLQRFLGGLPTNDRLVWLATNLLTPPLTHSEAEARAGAPIELFNILQGDIIRTGAAYQMGSRNEVGTYIVATSTCDLVPGRRTTALLLPVQAKRGDEFSSAARLAVELDALTLFKPRKHFYLPVLQDDDDGVAFNVAHLDPLAVISNEAVNLSQRRASLSYVGWRVFGALVRELLVREAANEDVMRQAGRMERPGASPTSASPTGHVYGEGPPFRR